MRYRLQRHDGTDCSATMVPITVLRMVPIQRYRHRMLTPYLPIGYYIKHIPLKMVLRISTTAFLKVTTESPMTQSSESQTNGLTFFTCYQDIHTF